MRAALPLLAAVLLHGLAANAPAQLLLGGDPYDARLRVMELPGNVLSTSTLHLDIPGSVFDGTNGVARHPHTGQVFVCFDASGAGLAGRGLGILGAIGATTPVTLIGDLGDRVSSIAFDSAGTLWGVTGENAATPEHLYTIDTVTAVMTPVMALGAGDDGESIAFNPGDGLLYHASGGDFGGPVVFESIDPVSGTITNIGYQPSGLTDNEIFGMVHVPASGEFIAYDLDQQLVSISTTGVKTPIADLSSLGFTFFIRGFALVEQTDLCGTGDDLATSYSLDFAPVETVPWGGTVLQVGPGESVFVTHSSPAGSLAFIGTFIVYGSLLSTASVVADLTEPFPGLHLDFSGLFAVFNGAAIGMPFGLPPAGYHYGFIYPGGLQGSTIVLQAAVSTSLAANGIFAATHGLRVDFQ